MPLQLSQKQSNAWYFLEDQTTTEILYGGGAGGGKSFLGCVWHIHRRLTYPKTRGFIGRVTLRALEESTLITLFKVCDEVYNLRPGVDYIYNAQKNVIKWKNGSKTILRELEYLPRDPDFQRLGSTEYTDAFIDEAAEITEKAFDILNSRIRWMLHEYGLVPKIFMSCNPGYNWVRDKYVKDKDGNRRELKPHQKFIRALVTDNPDKGFRDLYIGQLEKIRSEYDRARLLDGDWDAEERTGGEFYKTFQPEINILPNPTFATIKGVYDKALPVHLTWDFNVRPYVTCNIWQLPTWTKDLKRAIQIDEITLPDPKNRTKYACLEFIKRYPDHDAGMFVYGDPAGQQEDTRSEKGEDDFKIILKELAQYKPVKRVEGKAPSVVMRGNFINEIFDLKIKGVELFIATKCRDTIKDYNNLKEDADGTKQKKKVKDPKTKVSYEPLGHCSDANDYFICWILRSEYLNFSKGGARPKEIKTGGREISAKNAY